MKTTWHMANHDLDQFTGQVKQAIQAYGRKKIVAVSLLVLAYSNPDDAQVLARVLYKGGLFVVAAVLRLIGVTPF